MAAKNEVENILQNIMVPDEVESKEELSKESSTEFSNEPSTEFSKKELKYFKKGKGNPKRGKISGADR